MVPRKMIHKSLCIGCKQGSDKFLHRNVAYLRMWEEHELTDSEVSFLYALHMLAEDGKVLVKIAEKMGKNEEWLRDGNRNGEDISKGKGS